VRTDAWPTIDEGPACALGEFLDADTIEILRRNYPPAQVQVSPVSEDGLRALLQGLRQL
jgi:hypothetical protein